MMRRMTDGDDGWWSRSWREDVAEETIMVRREEDTIMGRMRMMSLRRVGRGGRMSLMGMMERRMMQCRVG